MQCVSVLTLYPDLAVPTLVFLHLLSLYLYSLSQLFTLMDHLHNTTSNFSPKLLKLAIKQRKPCSLQLWQVHAKLGCPGSLAPASLQPLHWAWETAGGLFVALSKCGESWAAGWDVPPKWSVSGCLSRLKATSNLSIYLWTCLQVHTRKKAHTPGMCIEGFGSIFLTKEVSLCVHRTRAIRNQVTHTAVPTSGKRMNSKFHLREIPTSYFSSDSVEANSLSQG